MKRAEFAFSKARRLRKQKDFDLMFQAARKISRRGLVVRYRNNGLSTGRLGLMIGKRAGNAVERNRVRRVLREVFRRNKEYQAKSVDILVTLYRPMRQLNKKELADLFSESLDKLSESLNNQADL